LPEHVANQISVSQESVHHAASTWPDLWYFRPLDRHNEEGVDVTEKAKGLMLNMATVDPAHEEEFNRWYEAEHIPDVLRRFPQITKVRRYRQSDGEEPRYLVMYEYTVADKDEFRKLTSPDHPLRHELWKIYDEAVGSFAKRSRRFFWQIYP